jgi:four helix bundle protein
MSYSSFENLEIWQRSTRLAVTLYDALKDCRDFGLKDQMTRSAVSIASNIAEGVERDSKIEFSRFLHIAKGSAAELRTQVYIAGQIGLFSKAFESELAEELKALSSMIHALVKVLKPKKT